MKNTSGIYAIIHRDSGKFYIGSAQRLQHRWKKHQYELNQGTHHSIHLQRAWAKYGVGAFEFSPLFLCPPDELIIQEQAVIDALHPAFNICPTAGSVLGRKNTPEQSARLSERLKGNTRRLGTVTSEEGKMNISKGRKGVKTGSPSQQTRDKISRANKGRRWTPEQYERFLLAQHGPKPRGVVITCAACGTEKYVAPYLAATAKYCSHKCFGASHRGHQPLTIQEP